MTDTIIARIEGSLGRITLNRPKALNALTEEMCVAITQALITWQDDDTVKAVLVDGEGDRAFCAGGDVIMLHDSGKAKDSRAETFWRVEYALNELIQSYSKPYIALIDGIVMGGGVGLSVHGQYRVAGNTTLFAMPETGIGYFPDVGGTYFLPRLGMAVGNWLGLTGARLGPTQSVGLGVATHFVPTQTHGAMIEALSGADDVAAVLEHFNEAPPECEDIPDAVNMFDATRVADILAALDSDGSDWTAHQAKLIRRKSPLAMATTLEAMRRGADLDFRAAMSAELDLSLNFLTIQDFYEGIRAQLIDKDRNPGWSHDGVESVTVEQVERMFRQAADPRLEFLT
ncbi:enoyl-CoA hydratase [Algimonas arctica]|uniref:3-hydroxyisobutyryl-CoA hydrolase n=1 Tax=Algimonas arctica TaxID=1479486 RepID=A0A8J3CRL8_9PROT|nr:enoyl-CoA hydratase/isomerase family protein [Algimonas arctica]GHB01890.1 enoyl-CoA hydratase [Algimonas arctica]